MDTLSTRARLSRGRNDVRLLVEVGGQPFSNFRLREFENLDGLAMVHRVTLQSLERVRQELCLMAGEEVWVIITDAVRTPRDLDRLALRFGWTEEGGLVARDSKHLIQYGGIAVDLIAMVASSRARVPQQTLGKICRKYFDFVKDDYKDGHVHADNREQALQENNK